MFGEVLRDANLEQASLVDRGEKWELWRAIYEDGLTNAQTRFVLHFLTKPPRAAVFEAHKRLPSAANAQTTTIILKDALSSTSAREEIRGRFVGFRVTTVAQIQQRLLTRNLKPPQIDAPPYYIAPTVVTPAFKPEGTAPNALHLLRKWLAGTSDPYFCDARVGVLLAPAGAGKTAILQQLLQLQCSDLALLTGEQSTAPVPVDIDSNCWRDGDLDAYKITEIIGKAFRRRWGSQPDNAQIERAFAHRTFSVMIDGLDELCAHYGGKQDIRGIIADLIAKLHDIDGPRVLLTCRYSFWHGNTEPNINNQVQIFELLPFSAAQQSAFLEKRFPGQSQKPKRDRAYQLLSRLATRHTEAANPLLTASAYSLATLPWVAVVACQAVDDDTPLRSSAAEIPTILTDYDPLNAILSTYCEREITRGNVTAEIAIQIDALTVLAVMEGDSFLPNEPDECLRFVADKNDNDQYTLRNHGLLCQEGNGRMRFQYPEVKMYLQARAAAMLLLSDKPPVDASSVIANCCEPSNPIVDYISSILAGKMRSSAITERMRKLRLDSHDSGFQGGLLQIILRVARDQKYDSEETRDFLESQLGLGGAGYFDQGVFIGSFRHINFSDYVFRRCLFQSAKFDKCQFNHSSFENCSFNGDTVFSKSCSGLSAESWDPECTFDKEARKSLKEWASVTGRIEITANDVKSGTKAILQLFATDQQGFRTKKKIDIETSARNRSDVGSEIFAALLASNVIEEFVATNDVMLKVIAKNDVRNFLHQAVVGGAVLRAIESVLARHQKL